MASPEPSAAPDGIPEDRLAVDVFLEDDVRKRTILLDELLHDLATQRSEVTKCIRLAKAKRIYEDLYPHTRHGAASAKDPNSGSLKPLAFLDFAKKKTGFSRAAVADWAAIGEGITERAHREMLGTKLANRKGQLKKVAVLGPHEQFRVANMYRVGLEKNATELLHRLHGEYLKREAQAHHTPDPVVIEEQDEVIVPKSAEGIEADLRGHLLRISDEGDVVRVRFLCPVVRPKVLATEGWTGGVERAALALRKRNFCVEVSPMEVTSYARPVWQKDLGPTAARHTLKLYLTSEDTADCILVTRWEDAEHAGPPLYVHVDGAASSQRYNGPVVIVSRAPELRGFPWSVERKDIAEAVEAAIVRLVTSSAPSDTAQ